MVNIEWNDSHVQLTTKGDGGEWAVQRMYFSKATRANIRSSVPFNEDIHRPYELLVTGFQWARYWSNEIRAMFIYLCTYVK